MLPAEGPSAGTL